MKRVMFSACVPTLSMLLYLAALHTPARAQLWRVTPTIPDAVGDTCAYLDCYAEVANLSPASAALRIQVISSAIPAGWTAAICVFSCYPPDAVDIVETFGPLEDTLVHITWTTSSIPARGSITCRFSDTATGTVIGTFTFTASTLRTSIDEGIVIAPSCRLVGHYPNPYDLADPAAGVAFSYSTTDPGHVTLQIHDLVGRLIATVVDEIRPAGLHRAWWDGRDAWNRPVAPGIYVYRLMAGHSSSARRLLVTR